MATFNKNNVEPAYTFTPAGIRKVASTDATNLLVKMNSSIMNKSKNMFAKYEKI